MYAEDIKKWATAYVKWTYNQQILRVNTGWLVYILAIPSIIASDVSITDLQELLNQKKLALHQNWYKAKILFQRI